MHDHQSCYTPPHNHEQKPSDSSHNRPGCKTTNETCSKSKGFLNFSTHTYSRMAAGTLAVQKCHCTKMENRTRPGLHLAGFHNTTARLTAHMRLILAKLTKGNRQYHGASAFMPSGAFNRTVHDLPKVEPNTILERNIGALMLRIGYWGYCSITIKGPYGNTTSNYSIPTICKFFRPHAAVT